MVPQWTVGDRLKKAREATGRTQFEFGEEIGLSRGIVANLETDTTPAKKPIIVAWAFATGVDLHWLLTGEELPEPDPDGPDGGLLPDLDSNQEPADYYSGTPMTYLIPKTNDSVTATRKAA
jgi:transcriptional regulator with XRE-family HTH domain